ncbi:MAG TPA: glycosyltransferase [Ktedonobacterales bacterium]|nr:glycosyltransferase [Ktedonobacterales bacterium]
MEGASSPFSHSKLRFGRNLRSPQSKPQLSLVVPTRNERESVASLVSRLAGALGALEYEILFVDDSDDDTPEVVSQAAAADPTIRLLHREPAEREGGLSTAVVQGMRQAHGELIAILDGDLQHPPEALPGMVAAAEDADIVVASRYIAGGSSAGLDGWHRQIASRGSKLAAATLFRRARVCSDPMSGFFLIRREVIAGVDLRPIGFKILLEILVRGRWTRLSEVPYRFGEREDGASKASMEQGREYLRHLRELRLTGERGRGPVRYRALRVPVGPDDPQPLDDDLPEDPEVTGKRRRKLLWMIALLAMALRLILLPIGHWWDLTVDYNLFIDLAHNHSPYDTMVYLSHIAAASGWDTHYEYYAYPPIPLYFYWPLAHLFAWLHPHMGYFIPMSGSFAMPTLPLDFFVWLKLPMWIADFAIAALLARMSGTIRGFRDYLLNPYVLLISAAWTFDSVMVLGLLLGAFWLQQGKFARSGVAMAFGTMVKFVPAIAVPTFVLYLIKRKRPLHEIVIFLVSYGIACLIFLGPYLNGLLYVVNFHSGRVGGGMTWEMFWRLWTFFPKGTDLDPMSLAIGAFGTPTLVIVLLLAYWYVFVNESMRFNRMIIVTLLAFFVGSKLVNEQYALVVLPFAFLEAHQVGGAWRWLYRLLWVVPLAFAIMRVPIDRFLWLFYHMVLGARADAIAATGITGFESAFIPWQNAQLDQIAIVVLGCGFFLLSIVGMVWPVRPPRIRYRHSYVAQSEGVTLPAGETETAALAGQAAAGARAADMGNVGGDTAPQPEVAVPR